MADRAISRYLPAGTVMIDDRQGRRTAHVLRARREADPEGRWGAGWWTDEAPHQHGWSDVALDEYLNDPASPIRLTVPLPRAAAPGERIVGEIDPRGVELTAFADLCVAIDDCWPGAVLRATEHGVRQIVTRSTT